jgi:hypothetical protein
MSVMAIYQQVAAIRLKADAFRSFDELKFPDRDCMESVRFSLMRNPRWPGFGLGLALSSLSPTVVNCCREAELASGVH